MDESFVLWQLSDLHVGAHWQGVDSFAALDSLTDALQALRPSPDAIVVSGDLAENAADAEYEHVRARLSPFGVPVYVVAGNHDDRGAVRRAFDLPGGGSEPVQYAADLARLRLVVVDSTSPGRDGGRLDRERLAWLEATLAEADAPTMLAMHHPPMPTGLPAFDRIGLADADRAAFGSVVARYSCVRSIVAGHAHRPIAARFGACAVVVAPSTYLQTRLELEADGISFDTEAAPGVVIHALVGDGVSSHFQFLDRARPGR
jgi:3',5'-cyclic-AMP phosphodiesterase